MKMKFRSCPLICHGVDVSLPAKNGFLAKVMKTIEFTYHYQGGLPSIIDTAESMGMSVRTIQRYLQMDHAISYSKIIEQYQKNLLAYYVADKSVNTAQIANKCGFSSAGSLLRFVKNHWGLTTRELRMVVNATNKRSN